MDDSSWHSAQLEGCATYCQAGNCNIGHADVHASKRNQQFFVLTTQQYGLVLVELEPLVHSKYFLTAWAAMQSRRTP